MRKVFLVVVQSCFAEQRMLTVEAMLAELLLKYDWSVLVMKHCLPQQVMKVLQVNCAEVIELEITGENVWETQKMD